MPSLCWVETGMFGMSPEAMAAFNASSQACGSFDGSGLAEGKPALHAGAAIRVRFSVPAVCVCAGVRTGGSDGGKVCGRVASEEGVRGVVVGLVPGARGRLGPVVGVVVPGDGRGYYGGG